MFSEILERLSAIETHNNLLEKENASLKEQIDKLKNSLSGPAVIGFFKLSDYSVPIFVYNRNLELSEFKYILGRFHGRGGEITILVDLVASLINISEFDIEIPSSWQLLFAESNSYITNSLSYSKNQRRVQNLFSKYNIKLLENGQIISF
jgi:hypothetical protein